MAAKLTFFFLPLTAEYETNLLPLLSQLISFNKTHPGLKLVIQVPFRLNNEVEKYTKQNRCQQVIVM